MAKRKGIDDQLRDAIRGSGLTHYRIGKDAGVNPTVIGRFMAGGEDRRDIRLGTAAKLAAVLELQLSGKSQ